MFDLHAHILPALDDGPATLEEAITTVSMLAREGVTDVVATPHFDARHPQAPADEVQRRVRALQRIVTQMGVAMRIYAGHAASLAVDVETALARGRLATINDGPYVLLDIPTELARSVLPPSLPGLIERLRRAGYIPVLARVERCPAVHEHPMALAPLVEAGALTQVTAASLVGAHGAAARATAVALLRGNLAHVLASGCHSVTERPPRFAEGVRAAEQIVGQRRAWELSVTTPQAMVLGLAVDVPLGPSGR